MDYLTALDELRSTSADATQHSKHNIIFTARNMMTLRRFLPAFWLLIAVSNACVNATSITTLFQPLLSPMYRPRYRPQRRPQQNQRQQQRQPYSSSVDLHANFRSHYLDDPNWMTNKQVRLWDGRTNNKRRRPNQYSWTTRLVVANVAGFALQTLLGDRFTNWGVKLSHKILNGQELYRLLTPVFLHGNLLHLGMNMYSLTNVGPMTEQLFGPGRFLVSYLVSGAAGNLLSAIMCPNPALGASGAVFGVLAMFGVFLTRNDWLLGQQGEAMQSQVMQSFGINLMYGFFSPRVDNWGHLGGAMGGAAMAYYFGPRLFLANLPTGEGRDETVIVDKPIARLPPWIESVPEKFSNRINRLVRRMQVWKFTDNLPSRPWRRSGGRLKRRNYKSRQFDAPNQSIKPNLDEF